MTTSTTADVPRILTSSWFTPLPAGCLKIGISRGTPRGMPAGYRRYPKLAPDRWFNSVSPAEYQQRYFDEILGKLDPAEVVHDLVAMSNGKVPVLVCYEKPPPDMGWCHRALCSAWLHDTVGIEVFELGHETCGCGWKHPKLHSDQMPAGQMLGLDLRPAAPRA